MSDVGRFMAYAAAFEQAYTSDDWSVVEPFFTEDAVYETLADPPFAGRYEGRPAILAYFKNVLDGFDRRFDERRLDLLGGPEMRDGAVWIRWAVTYRVAGAPDLRFEGEERAHFDGERIRRLEDRIPKEEGARAQAFMGEHGGKLHSAA